MEYFEQTVIRYTKHARLKKTVAAVTAFAVTGAAAVAAAKLDMPLIGVVCFVIGFAVRNFIDCINVRYRYTVGENVIRAAELRGTRKSRTIAEIPLTGAVLVLAGNGCVPADAVNAAGGGAQSETWLIRGGGKALLFTPNALMRQSIYDRISS